MHTVHKGPSRERVETERERRERNSQPVLTKETWKTRRKVDRKTDTGKVNVSLITKVSFWVWLCVPPVRSYSRQSS